MGGSGSGWCEDSSNHNGGRPVHLLFDKPQSSENLKDSQETNRISTQTSKSTVNLDKALRRKSFVYPISINSLLEIGPSETPSENKEDFIWSFIDRFHKYQKRIIEPTTGIRHNEGPEPAHASTVREWGSVD